MELQVHSWEEAFDTASRTRATIYVPMEAITHHEDQITEAALRHGFQRIAENEDEACYVQVH